MLISLSSKRALQDHNQPSCLQLNYRNGQPPITCVWIWKSVQQWTSVCFYRNQLYLQVTSKQHWRYTVSLRVHHVREREDWGVLKRTLGNPRKKDYRESFSGLLNPLSLSLTWCIRKLTVYLRPVDVVYLDFSRAFDKMPHDVLLCKLSEMFNIGGNLWIWMKSFLCRRRHRVLYKGPFSEWAPVLFGVPQGSVLGPLLFNLFINDVPNTLESPCALFADNTIIYRPVRDITDSSILQRDLDRVLLWCVSNGMKLNVNKTKVMRISCSRKNIVEPVYLLNGAHIESVLQTKYLGVIINTKLSWDDHVEYITRRANRLLGLITSMPSGLATSALLALYKSLVLPILEYGLPAWNPTNRNLCDRLESIQRRATRIILKQRRQQMPYPERLRLLNWVSLESRRKYLLINFVAKALYNIVESSDISSKSKSYKEDKKISGSITWWLVRNA